MTGLLDTLWQMQPDYLRNAGGNIADNLGGLLAFLNQRPPSQQSGLADNAPDLSVYPQAPSGGPLGVPGAANAAPAPMQPPPPAFGGSPINMAGFGPQLGGTPPPALTAASSEFSPMPSSAPPPQGPMGAPQGNPFMDFLGSVPGRLQRAAAIAESPQGYMQLNKPQIIETGTDPFTGQKSYATVNPITGQARAVNVQGTGLPGSETANSLQAFRDKLSQGASPEELTAALPSEMQGYLKDMLAGKAIPTFLGRAGTRQQLMTIAHAINPGWDETNIKARQEIATSLANGKLGDMFASTGKLGNHLYDLFQNIDQLGNTKYGGTWINGFTQFVKGVTGDEQFQTARSQFEVNRRAVASEMANLMRKSGGSEKEAEDWYRSLDTAESPVALKAAAARAIDLVRGRVDPELYKMNQIFGSNKTLSDYIPPQTAQKFDAIHGSLLGGGSAPAAPAASPSVPAPQQRQVGQTVTTAKGTFRWNGTGWDAAR